MIVGLQVTAGRETAVLVADVGWASPPPAGATWACCRRPGLPLAAVTGHQWAGLGDEPAVWVLMTGDRRLVNHLCSEHGFGTHYA